MAATESSTRATAALDELYRRHVGDVYRYTYAVLGNHADAEDVTQTTFVNALRALERGEQPREASHWLLAIAHNLVRQRWRQAAARPTMVELVHDVPDEAPAEDDVQLDELVRALQRIPPSQREALVMRELEGRPYKEIAELLGLTTAALETLLFRARRSLAEEIENLVTCQTAELALSKQSDGRLSRKERRRLDAHIAECTSCARFAQTQARQRKAFKGLAMLPLPVGLALFRDVPVASAGVVTSIGQATTAGAGGTTTAAGGGAAGGSATTGGAVAGGSLLGGAAVKVAAIVAVTTVAVGVGYQGVNALRDAPQAAVTASERTSGSAGRSERSQAQRATAATAATAAKSTTSTPSVSTTEEGIAPYITKKGLLSDEPEATHEAATTDSSPAGDGGASGRSGGTTAGGEAPGGAGSGDAPGSGGTTGAGGAPAGGGSTTTPPPVSEPGVQPTPKTSAPTTKPKSKPQPKAKKTKKAKKPKKQNAKAGAKAGAKANAKASATKKQDTKAKNDNKPTDTPKATAGEKPAGGPKKADEPAPAPAAPTNGQPAPEPAPPASAPPAPVDAPAATDTGSQPPASDEKSGKSDGSQRSGKD